MKSSHRILLSGAAVVALLVTSQASFAQDASAPGDAANSAGEQEIIVTAQKRAERISDVGMAITAATGDTLLAKGITSPAALTKIEPSFTYAQSSYGAPVYSLRGVGFYDTALGATPAVTVYVDQVPVPYSAMTRSATFDVERVEILKGPQGTLFGQNSTGGAINYIAAKPTNDFSIGGDISVGRFSSIEGNAYISGPLGEGLKARLAVHTEQGASWQKSYTRSASLGSVDRTYARLLLDWEPSERLSFELNVNGGVDRSDTQAGQLIAVTFPLLAAGLVNYPRAPQNARAADWDINDNFRRDDEQYHIALTGTYDLGSDISLKSITSYQRFDLDARSDVDGTTYQVFTGDDVGTVKSFSQELQLQGTGSGFNWIVGGNYSRDKVDDSLLSLFRDSRFSLAGILSTRAVSIQDVKTEAVFANLEYELVPSLKLQAGLRYSSQQRDFQGCTYDSGDGTSAAFLRARFGIIIQPGDCATLSTSFQPGVFRTSLDEDNVSWRAGFNWKVGRNSLIYTNVSKGYKAGAFPTAGASSSPGLLPAVQESLLAYEAGFKLSFLDRAVQLDGAVFYYDYKNKQVRGRIIDPTFGSLNRLINIPQSHETGAELSVVVRPMEGLTLNASAVYLDSKIEGPFVNLDALGAARDLGDNPFPYTPKWSGLAGVQYEAPINSGWKAFTAADLTWRNASNAGLGEVALFRLPSSQVLDLRAGVASTDGRWRVTIWGKNVTNEYYWNNVVSVTGDNVIRFAAMPVTYGLTVGFKY